MFKTPTRTRTRPFTSTPAHQVPGFAETQFLHAEDDEDYSGFAPTQMFEDEPRAPLTVGPRAAESSHAAAAARADASTEDGAMPASWVTSRSVDVQAAGESRAHEAAHQARAVIAAQRRTDVDVREAPAADAATEVAPPTGWMRRVQRAVQRVLPIDFYSVLPLFICVSLSMALISAVLPLFDKP